MFYSTKIGFVTKNFQQYKWYMNNPDESICGLENIVSQKYTNYVISVKEWLLSYNQKYVKTKKIPTFLKENHK